MQEIKHVHAENTPHFHHFRTIFCHFYTAFTPQINIANAWITHRNRRNHDRICRNRTTISPPWQPKYRKPPPHSPQRTSQPLFLMWILLFWVWFSSLLNVDKAIFNIVFACSSAGMAVLAEGKCWYKMLIYCKMEVRTVECFVKFWKSGLETPETHHHFATLATKIQEIKNVHDANTPQFCRFRTAFTPQISLATAWITHRNRRNNDRTCRNQSWNRRTQHRIFAATHLATAVLNVNFAVLSVVFIAFERG